MRLTPALIALSLAACHDQRPPAPTAEENRELNEAGAMLNEMAQNEEGPAADAADPSVNLD